MPKLINIFFNVHQLWIAFDFLENISTFHINSTFLKIIFNRGRSSLFLSILVAASENLATFFGFPAFSIWQPVMVQENRLFSLYFIFSCYWHLNFKVTCATCASFSLFSFPVPFSSRALLYWTLWWPYYLRFRAHCFYPLSIPKAQLFSCRAVWKLIHSFSKITSLLGPLHVVRFSEGSIAFLL